MRGGGIILGDWTHRRGDVGGARAVSAEIARARPRIAWTFHPPHAGNVDQVRVAGERVYVATLEPGDPTAVGWEHATIYALDASTGRVAATRALPDPVPVAAMIVEGATVHVLATRHGEPVFWYALDAFDLRPRHRRALALDRSSAWDVLEAWALPSAGSPRASRPGEPELAAPSDGGLWLELESTPAGKRRYAFVDGDSVSLAPAAYEPETPDDATTPRDACCVGHTLYAPRSGKWDDAGSATPPSIVQFDPGADASTEPEPWARVELTGPRSHAHALAAGGAVNAVAVAVDPTKDRRALVQALVVDRASGVVRAQSAVERLATRDSVGGKARLARRPNGDVLFQCVSDEGAPASDLWRVTPGGEVIEMRPPRESLILDASLGDAVLMHSETRRGSVIVSAIDIDKERLLGKRATTLWSVETPDMGGAATVYAGAGHVFARGAHGLAAIRV
jgi:hypothetical protein